MIDHTELLSLDSKTTTSGINNYQKTVQAKFGSCCSVALPILPAEASPERGEGDGWALQPGASAIRSAPLAEPLGAALWGSGWSLLGVSGRGGST